MHYEAVLSRGTVDEWRVEAINDEGEIAVTIFSGPLAQERAKEYAGWMNRKWELRSEAIPPADAALLGRIAEGGQASAYLRQRLQHASSRRIAEALLNPDGCSVDPRIQQAAEGLRRWARTNRRNVCE